MSEEKLKPCPFCGFQPVEGDEDFIYPTNRERTVWQAVCYETAGGCGASVLANSPKTALDVWNTRAESGEAQSLRSRIEAAIKFREEQPQ